MSEDQKDFMKDVLMTYTFIVSVMATNGKPMVTPGITLHVCI
jgi:hypothetical protein